MVTIITGSTVHAFLVNVQICLFVGLECIVSMLHSLWGEWHDFESFLPFTVLEATSYAMWYVSRARARCTMMRIEHVH